MKAQHTPGPWHIEKHNKVVWQDSGGPGNSSYATSYPITLIVHEQLDDPRLRTCVAQLDNSTESDGNARLIATAPELLHVANNVYFLLSNIDWNGRNTEQGQKILSDLRDTIAKATGQ